MSNNRDGLGGNVDANREALNYRTYYVNITLDGDEDKAQSQDRNSVKPASKDEITARRSDRRFLWVRLGSAEHPDLAVHQPWIDKIKQLTEVDYEAIYLQLTPGRPDHQPYELLVKRISADPYFDSEGLPVELVIGNPFDQIETAEQAFAATNYIGGVWRVGTSGSEGRINLGPYSEPREIERAQVVPKRTIDFAVKHQLESSGIVITTQEERQFISRLTGQIFRESNVYRRRFPLGTVIYHRDYQYKTDIRNESKRSSATSTYEPPFHKSIYRSLAETLEGQRIPRFKFGSYDTTSDQTLYSAISEFASLPLDSYDIIVIEVPALYRDKVLFKETLSGGLPLDNNPNSELLEKAAINLMPKLAALGRKLLGFGYLTQGMPSSPPEIDYVPVDSLTDRPFDWVPNGSAVDYESANIRKVYRLTNIGEIWGQSLPPDTPTRPRQLIGPLDDRAYFPHTRSFVPPFYGTFPFAEPGKQALLMPTPLPTKFPQNVLDGEGVPVTDVRIAKGERWRNEIANPFLRLYQYLDIIGALS